MASTAAQGPGLAVGGSPFGSINRAIAGLPLQQVARRGQRNGRGRPPATTFRRDVAQMVSMGNLILLPARSSRSTRPHTGRTDIPMTTKGEASASTGPGAGETKHHRRVHQPGGALRTAELAGLSTRRRPGPVAIGLAVQGRGPRVKSRPSGPGVPVGGVIRETPIIPARPSRPSATPTCAGQGSTLVADGIGGHGGARAYPADSTARWLELSTLGRTSCSGWTPAQLPRSGPSTTRR